MLIFNNGGTEIELHYKKYETKRKVRRNKVNTITQTNRTILFEEINPEKLNLLTLVGDVRG